MRIQYKIYNIQLLALLSAITACSSEDAVVEIDDTPKTPIEMSVGVEGPQSRATSVITDETSDKTYSAFGSTTGIWMAMQSDFKSLSNTSIPDDMDFKGGQTVKYCVTYGETDAANGTVNPVNISGDNVRYWDDAHARSSALSVWALAVPGKTGEIAQNGNWNTAAGWSSTNPTKTISWTINAAQDASTIAANDLCFSNNHVDYTGQSNTDRRLKFKKETSKFDQGKLVFYHALSKITIEICAGAGFKTDGSEMNFDNIDAVTLGTDAVPVKLKGFSLGGEFNVEDGAFSSTTASADIVSMYRKSTNTSNNPYYTLEALVMPGTELGETEILDAISFSIDGNRYKVSAATLKQRLIEGGATTFDKLEAGKNYIFKFTLNKTAIKVTATVKEWEVVNAANETPKINITDSYGETGTAFDKSYTFLRSLEISDNYFADATAAYADSKYSLYPQIYWPNHDTHYFFRGIWPETSTITTENLVASTTENGYKAIKVQNGLYTKNTYPSDLMVGYPRTSSVECKNHNKDVAENGICATEGDIRMNFQYVMSNVEVRLKTNTEPGATNAVTFDEHTKVEILQCYTDGEIKLSDGTADFTGKDKVSEWVMPVNGTQYNNRNCTVIPQSLEGLKFRITVKSNDSWEDKYETILGIKQIPVKINSEELTYIDKWEPGKHYIYNLYLTKTGIKVTATIKDWDTVTSSNNHIWM